VSTTEPWPTEEAATAAVDAVARKVYEQQFPPGSQFPTFDELPANDKVTVRNSVLPLVWTALEALPDPRYAAWEQGLQAGISTTSAQFSNPYSSGL
jgi:hypothetical protein